MKRTFPAFLIAAVLVVSLGGRSAAQFETRQTNSQLRFPFSIAIGDFRHDGRLDLVVASQELAVLFGNGDGTFQLPSIIRFPARRVRWQSETSTATEIWT